VVNSSPVAGEKGRVSALSFKNVVIKDEGCDKNFYMGILKPMLIYLINKEEMIQTQDFHTA